MSIEERFDLERQYRDHESPVARLAGRLKFQFCRRCGSQDGMQPVHRETLAEMIDYEIEILASWYRYCEFTTGGGYLYYPCPRCNWQIVIPDNYVPIPTGEVLEWRNTNPMAPDYDVLAREEPVLASTDSRKSAGL